VLARGNSSDASVPVGKWLAWYNMFIVSHQSGPASWWRVRTTNRLLVRDDWSRNDRR